MNQKTLMNALRLAGLTMLMVGVALGAMPALAQAADWQQHIPGSIPGGDAAAIAIPIVGMLMVFGAPALTVILVALFVFRHRERRQQLLNERVQKFLESGQPVPENLLADSEPLATPERHRNQGLICLGAGIGLTVFLTLMSGFAIGSLGLILIGIGLAKVLIWKLSVDKAAQ